MADVEECPCSFREIDRGVRRFDKGFWSNPCNPKTARFAAAVLVTGFPAGIGEADSIVIVIHHFLVDISFHAVLAFCLSTQIVTKRHMQANIYLDRRAAIIPGALGIRILLHKGNVPQVEEIPDQALYVP